MLVRRCLLASATLLGTVSGSLVLVAGPAQAAPVADYEMPFPCGQQWTGSTRDRHSPSPNAVDFNRTDDLGDPVVAAAPGTVLVADSVDNSGYGRWVSIDHGNGERTIQAHLQSVSVTTGQQVDQGQLIGTVGSTGNSSGPHLHFEERQGSTVIRPWFHGVEYVFGSTLASRNCVDVPLAANWFADRAAEPTVFRRLARAEFRIRRADGSIAVRRYGLPTDEPVPGDWDGNGRVNVGVYRPSMGRFILQSPAGKVRIIMGGASDRPVAGNWDGAGGWEVGLWSPQRAEFRLRAADGSISTVALGDGDDLPVAGDWDGDGVTDLGVFDQDTATYTLRKVDPDGTVWLATVVFGEPGDLPVVGDWDANGRTDLGAWALETATFAQRRATSAMTSARTVTALRYGRRR